MKEININDLKISPSDLIGNKWMLITAGSKDDFNTMTAGWGEIGSIWGHGASGRATATIFVRPSRYTDKYIDSNETFSLCFFDEQYKQDLGYLGSHSGRDENKIEKTKLHPIFIDEVPCFKEANLILICKKIYKDKLKEECFIDKSIL